MNKKFYKEILFTIIIIIFIKPVYADDKMTLGLEIYNNKAQCGVCHSLQSANSEGQIGPNLDDLKPKMDQIIYVVKNGIGLMPSFESLLTNDEIEAVAYYVFNSTNN